MSMLRTAKLKKLLQRSSVPRFCRFLRWQRLECSADIRSDLGQATERCRGQNRRDTLRERWNGRLAASFFRCSPLKGKRLTRTLRSIPCVSTRDPLQYFNTLLNTFCVSPCDGLLCT